jgi:hypothetical protein
MKETSTLTCRVDFESNILIIYGVLKKAWEKAHQLFYRRNIDWNWLEFRRRNGYA